MKSNTTFNNISAISWQWVLLVEKIGVPRENHEPASTFKFSVYFQTDLNNHCTLCSLYNYIFFPFKFLMKFLLAFFKEILPSDNFCSEIIIFSKACTGVSICCLGVVASYSTQHNQGPLWSWSYGSWVYNYLCNQYLSPLTLWVWIPLRRYNIMW